MCWFNTKGPRWMGNSWKRPTWSSPGVNAPPVGCSPTAPFPPGGKEKKNKKQQPIKRKQVHLMLPVCHPSKSSITQKYWPLNPHCWSCPRGHMTKKGVKCHASPRRWLSRPAARTASRAWRRTWRSSRCSCRPRPPGTGAPPAAGSGPQTACPPGCGAGWCRCCS